MEIRGLLEGDALALEPGIGQELMHHRDGSDRLNLLTTGHRNTENGFMHRLATCPGLDPPEDVVLVEQPSAEVLFLTSAGTDISCLDASLPSNPAWNERIRAYP